MTGKCIYICTTNLTNQIGVGKKVKMQCDALRDLGLSVTLINEHERSFIDKVKMLNIFSYEKKYKNIKRSLLSTDFSDVRLVYIRFGFTSKGMIDVLSTIKKLNPETKIVLEIPTYPYDQECESLKSRISLFTDKLYRQKLKGKLDLITALSPEKEIFGVPAYEISNGTSVGDYSIRVPKRKNEKEIHLIAVAGISKWHGFDRVIEGMKDYYQGPDQNIDVYFHVVGEGPYKTQLMKMTETYGLSQHVYFHGTKTGSDLEELYNTCDIGIGSLGLHRMFDFPHVSVLKTKEYCSVGIPFLTVDKDYIFKDIPFPFCAFVPDDESAVDIQSVLNFYTDITRKYEMGTIPGMMREYANNNLSWKRIYERVLNKLEEMFPNWKV